jgi:hypothetical protein
VDTDVYCQASGGGGARSLRGAKTQNASFGRGGTPQARTRWNRSSRKDVLSALDDDMQLMVSPYQRRPQRLQVAVCLLFKSMCEKNGL